MGRAANLLVAIAAACAATPAVSATASANANATIVDPNTVRMNWAVAMPSVRGGGDGASFLGSAPSMMMGMMMIPGNARLTVRRQDEDQVSLTAPTSFEVIRADGENALIVRTAADAEVRIGVNGVIAAGSLQGASAASIGVGRGLTRVSTQGGIDGYSETLTVVVQYN